MSRLLTVVLAAAALSAGPAAAQQDYNNLTQDHFLNQALERMRQGIADLERRIEGGAMTELMTRLDSLEDEIARLTAAVERVEHAQRQSETATKRKLTDLEYRIIELEGGDPSVLFEDDGADRPEGDAAETRGSETGGGVLGELRTRRAPDGGGLAPTGGGSPLDQGVAAIREGRFEAARERLNEVISSDPEGAEAGAAHYWLGESYYREGAYQLAAQVYLDGVNRHPDSEAAPDSLLKLGLSLAELGQTEVACSTFRAVGERYPEAVGVVSEARAEAGQEECR